MAGFRKHTTRDGKTVYFWRGTVPEKQADGTIVWRRVERSTKAGTLALAREAARRLEAEYHERAGRPLQEVADTTFAGAAILYMRSGGEKRFLTALLPHLGRMPLVDIDQNVMQDIEDRVYPGRAVSTKNRQLYTPVLSVLNYAAEKKLCPPPLISRPKGHDESPPLKLPGEDWFAVVLPLLPPKVHAAMLLCTLYGLRISEAIRRTPDNLDPNGWRLTIPKTKNGDPALIRLSKPVIEAIKAYDWRKGPWLFGTNSRSNIARAVKAACRKAGVPAYGTHAIGRHSFSTRALKSGKSLKWLMSAGRWKTASVPMARYGHLEKSEVQEEVNQLAAEWGEAAQTRSVIKLKTA